MWTCKKCEKPVYFAERIQSLGFDWHPPCLVCKECGKKLHPGQHAEHAAEPYCHHPCYGALFGPRLFGHGTRNECHGAFGKVNKAAAAERAALESRVKEYNQYFDGKPGLITCREANGRVVLDGMLRVHWNVNCLIHLKQEDETADSTTGVYRSTSNSSVNNSVASDDSDNEPLWRDETPPPSPPSTPIPSPLISSTSSNTTPNHPNWPPTPFATLKPSSSSSSISSLQEGPMSSPVQSYTHSVPQSLPISHPHCSLSALDDHKNSLSLETDASDISYATMKLRTVKRRKDIDQSITLSLTEAAMRVNKLNETNGNHNEKEDDIESFLRPKPQEIDTSTVTEECDSNKNSRHGKVMKRVSFSQVDVKESEEVELRKCATKGKAVIRRRPGRRMDKKKVKRRCSINGHLYLRETSSFHLDANCPPAIVRVSSLTSTEQLIATILEKYKIEMSISNFALYVFKDNGEQRKLAATDSPLVQRVLLGPRDEVARLVLCDDNKTTEITPKMAEFVHLSLAECRAILRQYDQEEAKEIRNIRTRYDDMKFYIQYWLEQMDNEAPCATLGGL